MRAQEQTVKKCTAKRLTETAMFICTIAQFRGDLYVGQFETFIVKHWRVKRNPSCIALQNANDVTETK